MNRINNKNLEALQAYWNKPTKKTEKEETKEEAKVAKEVETKKVQASALDALANQMIGAQLSKIDTSDIATEKRLEQAFANAPFMKALNDLQGLEEEFNFVEYAKNNMSGVNFEKLSKYLEKPLHYETVGGIENFNKVLIS